MSNATDLNVTDLNAADLAAADPVVLAVSGPDVVRTGEVANWQVRVSDASGRPVPEFPVFAQLGHGSGRPYRGMTGPDGMVRFEFTFGTPAASVQLQFAAAPREFVIGDRFAAGTANQSVTCVVLAAEPSDAGADGVVLLPTAPGEAFWGHPGPTA